MALVALVALFFGPKLSQCIAHSCTDMGLLRAGLSALLAPPNLTLGSPVLFDLSDLAKAILCASTQVLMASALFSFIDSIGETFEGVVENASWHVHPVHAVHPVHPDPRGNTGTIAPSIEQVETVVGSVEKEACCATTHMTHMTHMLHWARMAHMTQAMRNRAFSFVMRHMIAG